MSLTSVQKENSRNTTKNGWVIIETALVNLAWSDDYFCAALDYPIQNVASH